MPTRIEPADKFFGRELLAPFKQSFRVQDLATEHLMRIDGELLEIRYPSRSSLEHVRVLTRLDVDRQTHRVLMSLRIVGIVIVGCIPSRRSVLAPPELLGDLLVVKLLTARALDALAQIGFGDFQPRAKIRMGRCSEIVTNERYGLLAPRRAIFGEVRVAQLLRRFILVTFGARRWRLSFVLASLGTGKERFAGSQGVVPIPVEI